MKYNTIFIDLDDTLIDTAENTKTTVKEIYDDYALNQYFESFDVFYNNWFKPNNLRLWHEYEHQRITKEQLMYERFIGAFSSVSSINETNALEINTDYLKRIVKKSTLIPGTKEVLEHLKPKYKIVIISNGFTELQYDKIENAGLTKYFDEIILSDKIGINKPQAGIFEYALKQTNTSISESIMIGDNYMTDIKGAYRVGIDQIWYNPNQIGTKEFEPTYIISHLQELKSIL